MIYVQLGRFGDIINILPLLYREFQETKNKPILWVQKDYASILEGVSYISPRIWEGDWMDLQGVVAEAEKEGEVKVSQVCGPPHIVRQYAYSQIQMGNRQAESFQKESWRIIDQLDLWRTQPPLIFDDRNYEREAALVKQFNPDVGWILVSSGGVSSPFPHKDLLWSVLAQHFGKDHLLIDLGNIQAERFYDLLGLMEHPNTKCMVLTDSAPLHLAYATGAPVCALVTDTPSLWHGAAYRPNQHISYIRYSAFPDQYPQMVEAIQKKRKRGYYLTPPKGIYHLWQTAGELNDRECFAQKTWETVYETGPWVSRRIPEGALTRTYEDQRGKLPYIKDIIRQGCVGLPDEAIICFTNSDTCFSPDLTERLRSALISPVEALHGHRRDFTNLGEPKTPQEVAEGQFYPGSDIFIFRVGWWRQVQHDYPDMLTACEAWDWILRELIKKHGGSELKDAIYHERHESRWYKERLTLKGNIHNRELARTWLRANNLPLQELDFAEKREKPVPPKKKNNPFLRKKK